MDITIEIEKQIDKVLSKEKVTGAEWNDIVLHLKERIIDISNALPDQTAYIFSGAFRGVFKYKGDFYKIDCSFNEVRIKKVNNLTIKEVFK